MKLFKSGFEIEDMTPRVVSDSRGKQKHLSLSAA